ncbi:24056_t:CDS:2 [Dentiscutata erythropus]|uniref:24056_t:CDS:1 n=1 Tax=Dentiscutata erythropus TaxID=1348616 RepID=A0A9N9EVQ1_9GLOM|nr:24056_t:CDS:2 [Dentiscutata erythropus]
MTKKKKKLVDIPYVCLFFMMIKCTSYKHQHPPKAFVLDKKTYKTCATCLTNKAKTRANKKTISDHNQTIETISLNDLNEYVMELMESLENDMRLSFTIHVDVNMSDQNCNIKSIANMIVNNIEEGDGYSWVSSSPNLQNQHFNEQPLNEQPLNKQPLND